MKTNLKKISFNFITIFMLIIVVVLSSCATQRNSNTALSFWDKNSQAKYKLIDYVKTVTNPLSKFYIEPAERIAVFDFDGTLFCETDPNYFDYTLLVYRVLEDPDYKNKSTSFERTVAQKILTLNKTGVAASGLEVDHGRAIASAFKGMTLEEFDAYIQKFKQTEMPSYYRMNRGDGFYLPMVQVIKYLQANNFKIFIVSGTDRFIVRSIFHNSILNIPEYQIIGSDETTVGRNQNKTDGLTYQISKDEDVILGGDFIIKNLKMNKVSVIIQEIGIHPVLSFGNSTGDSSMADYTISNPKNLSLAFMLCCDDTVRENGNEQKAQNMYNLCEEHGWIPISMKNDWKTIYEYSVIKH